VPLTPEVAATETRMVVEVATGRSDGRGSGPRGHVSHAAHGKGPGDGFSFLVGQLRALHDLVPGLLAVVAKQGALTLGERFVELFRRWKLERWTERGEITAQMSK
jgi:hypothetical protein